MKIRLAILDSDAFYLNRIANVINTKYMDKLEIYSFTAEEGVYGKLSQLRIDVFLAGSAFEIDVQKIPERCGFAYLADSADIESLRGEQVICKFQKVELIYRQILNLFAEKAMIVTGNRMSAGGRVILFSGASGGVGCSCAAAACAVHFAGRGRRTVYLNLEMLGSADSYFSGEGQGNLRDIIYAIKSQKANLALKLESFVRQDATGVFYFSPPPTALDMLELKPEEIQQLIGELKSACGYDYVILDTDLSFGSEMQGLISICDDVVLVSDGTETSNGKLGRMLQAIQILEEQGERRTCDIHILYNRFASHNARKLEDTDISELGGIRRYEGYSPAQLAVKIAEQDVFGGLEQA